MASSHTFTVSDVLVRLRRYARTADGLPPDVRHLSTHVDGVECDGPVPCTQCYIRLLQASPGFLAAQRAHEDRLARALSRCWQ